MKKPPTSLQILEEIYKRYYGEFTRYSRESPTRKTKVYVPIDIRAIAEHFDVDGDIIHGRLYYHLDSKFSITKPDNPVVHFFLFQENSDKPHNVQFPILASAIAELREERDKYLWGIRLAAASFVVSIIAILIALVGGCDGL